MAANRKKRKAHAKIKPALTDVRLDKWLWAARLFKTRAIAVDAINGGKVHLNEARVKPSRLVHIGDTIHFTRGVDRYQCVIEGLNDKRRPAKEAQLLYLESSDSIQKREEEQAIRNLQNASVIHPDKRPNKKQRRRIIQFKGH
ncbi:MAG: RNA-binding protein [Cocleimonas sp.]|nr:RNA-binding protein [Cocleimonas sp.]